MTTVPLPDLLLQKDFEFLVVDRQFVGELAVLLPLDDPRVRPRQLVPQLLDQQQLRVLVSHRVRFQSATTDY